MSEHTIEENLSDEDIEKAIEELRYVLKSAAEKNPVDRQFIMDVTKTIEELTELRINKAKPWDPRLGGALKRIEEAETELGIPRRRKKKRAFEPTKKRLLERMRFWKKSR